MWVWFLGHVALVPSLAGCSEGGWERDDLGQVGDSRSRSASVMLRLPDTGQNTLMLPMCALSAPRQCKPLESHDLDTTARVHHADRRRGGRVAARGARSAAHAADRISKERVLR